MTRLTDRAVIRRALLEGAENIESLIDAYGEGPHDPEATAFLAGQRHVLERMREVYAKHFGPRTDPLAEARLVPLSELLKLPPTHADPAPHPVRHRRRPNAR